MNLSTLLWRAIAVSTLAFCHTGWAEGTVYDFEMIIFEQPAADADGYQAPVADPAEPFTTLAPLDTLQATGKVLGPVAHTLQRKGLPVIAHLAWRQSPPALDSESWHSIREGRIEGAIRITLGRYLHFDADLELRDVAAEQPYRIRFYRRLRSGELHYVDHPKLGAIIQAERYAAPPPPDEAADAGDGEPKPAQPGSDS